MKGERIFGFSNREVLILLFDLKVESKCCASQKQRVVIVFFESEKFHVFGGETFFSKRKKTKRNSCDVSSSKFLHFLVSSSLSLSLLRDSFYYFPFFNLSSIAVSIEIIEESRQSSFHNLQHVIIGRHAFREKRKRRRPAAVLSNAKLQRQVSRRWQNIERTCDPSTN